MKKILELEFTLNCSPTILFPRLSSSSGLTGWFADKVSNKGELFTFRWQQFENIARQSDCIENMRVRYHWLDEMGYFDFRIVVNEMTGQTTLFIRENTDEDEIETAMTLWNTQIANLKRLIGC